MEEQITQVQWVDVLTHIGGLGYVIMVVLAVLSVFSWAVILYKSRKRLSFFRTSDCISPALLLGGEAGVSIDYLLDKLGSFCLRPCISCKLSSVFP